MTVGISITNGKEAIVITDAMGSQSGRQSNQFTKLALCGSEKYHGALYGAGNGNDLLAAHIDSKNGASTLEETAKAIKDRYVSRSDVNEREYLTEMMRVAHNKAALIADEATRTSTLQQEIARIQQQYDQFINNPENATGITIIGYDRDSGRIRTFGVSKHYCSEFFADHMEIGSGRDGANWYFATKLQGVDRKKLEYADLLFFGLNAFTFATVNAGVGGTPEIARITPDNAIVLAHEQTTALANISARYLAERLSGQKQAHKCIDDTLAGDYGRVARAIGMRKDDLTSLYVPYSSVQEAANREFR